ncbi:MoeA N-terminal region (domain I and II) domain-containing protein [Besnoitia besnoiti]|uniref:molybdopterin adenylyltransferase n=1 Tax=Besnoitia besnoiti TaxID=94643 RepID=A0A2A9ML59_BESBE|nr:MoeA N-terminal region (domain I and II) domain-containing protein [Besnoitia besnoiti]PFH38755.1 MoeA N-terminal region (domain I and II) domain-containing protein [Besnoitia besnoiti]
MTQRRRRKGAAPRGEVPGSSAPQTQKGSTPGGPPSKGAGSRSAAPPEAPARVHQEVPSGHQEAPMRTTGQLIREESRFRMVELQEAQHLVDCEVRRLIHAELSRFNRLRGKAKIPGGRQRVSSEDLAPREDEGPGQRHREDADDSATRRGCVMSPPPLTNVVKPPFLDRRVASSVLAPRPFPAFRASVVDGYAVRLPLEAGASRLSSDIFCAPQNTGPESPERSRLALRIVGKVRAGSGLSAVSDGPPTNSRQHPHSQRSAVEGNSESNNVTTRLRNGCSDRLHGQSKLGDADTKQQHGAVSPQKERESSSARDSSLPVTPHASSACVYVTTGAPVPSQFQAVIPVEDCVVDKENALCMPDASACAALRPGTNIRAVGSDVAAGTPLLERGQLVGPAEEGLLSSFNIRQLEVLRRLNVHTLAIGDELISSGAGQGLTPRSARDEGRRPSSAPSGKRGVDGLSSLSASSSLASLAAEVFDSNSPTLAALIARRCPSVGVRAQHLLPDSTSAVRRLLLRLAAGAPDATPVGVAANAGDREDEESATPPCCPCVWCSATRSTDGEASERDADDGAADVLVTTGGVSMGDSDCVKLALLQLHEETQNMREKRPTGSQDRTARDDKESRCALKCESGCCAFRVETDIHFGRLNLKPGKPAIVASLRAHRCPRNEHHGSAGGATTNTSSPYRTLLVFGLPGNPCSSWVLFHLLVGPALQFFSSFSPSLSLSGSLPPQMPVTLAAAVCPDVSRPEFQRALVYVDFASGQRGFHDDALDEQLASPDLPFAPVPSAPTYPEAALSTAQQRLLSPSTYLHAFPTGPQQSSRLLSCCANANALLLVPPQQKSGRGRYEAGEALWGWLLDSPFPTPPKILLNLVKLQGKHQSFTNSAERGASLQFQGAGCRCGGHQSRDVSAHRPVGLVDMNAKRTEILTPSSAGAEGSRVEPAAKEEDRSKSTSVNTLRPVGSVSTASSQRAYAEARQGTRRHARGQRAGCEAHQVALTFSPSAVDAAVAPSTQCGHESSEDQMRHAPGAAHKGSKFSEVVAGSDLLSSPSSLATAPRTTTEHASHRHAAEHSKDRVSCSLGIVVVSDRCFRGEMRDACAEAALSTLRSASPLESCLPPLDDAIVTSEATLAKGALTFHGNRVTVLVVPDEVRRVQDAVMSLVCECSWAGDQARRHSAYGDADLCSHPDSSRSFRPGLVFVCGGTGLSSRDVTPQSLLPLFSVRCSGLEHLLLQASLAYTPLAALGRPCSGIITCRSQTRAGESRGSSCVSIAESERHHVHDVHRGDDRCTADESGRERSTSVPVAGCGGRALVFALPGSPKAVRECIQALIPVLSHALDVLASGV